MLLLGSGDLGVRQGPESQKVGRKGFDLGSFGEEEGIGESIAGRWQAQVSGDRINQWGMVGLVGKVDFHSGHVREAVLLAWSVGRWWQDQIPSLGSEIGRAGD